MKVNVKKLRKLILILALIILIGIILMLIALSNPTDNRLDYIYNNKDGNIEKMPRNVSPLFVEYGGIIEQNSIYKAMYLFVNDIVKEYYKEFKGDFSQENIENYFNKNSSEIEKILGITDKQAFVDFINTLKNLKGEELKLKQYIIISDSLTQVAGATKLVLAVDYEENERILFELRILNSSSEDKTPINYSAADDKYIDFEEEKNTETPAVDDYEKPGRVF